MQSLFYNIRKKYSMVSIILLNTVLLILFIELGLHITLYVKHKLNRATPQNKIDKIYQKSVKLQKIYPEKSLDDIYKIVQPFFHKNRRSGIGIEYHPWTQFRAPNSDSKHLNTNHFLRLSIPEKISFSKGENNYYDIYFFGGSTMYGPYVSDSQTIPSYFGKIIQEAYQGEQTIRIFNFGQPYYFSAQESMLLVYMLMENRKPDLVIFLDGLNESIQPSSSYFKHPFWTPKMRDLINKPYYYRIKYNPLLEKSKIVEVVKKFTRKKDNTERIHRKANVKSWTSSYEFPAEVASEKLVMDSIMTNYFETVKFVKRLGKAWDFETLFFWQPVPFFEFDQENDPFSEKREFPFVEYLFKKIKDQESQVDDFFFIADIFKNFNGLPYIDSFHYTPIANKSIAKRIYDAAKANNLIQDPPLTN